MDKGSGEENTDGDGVRHPFPVHDMENFFLRPIEEEVPLSHTEENNIQRRRKKVAMIMLNSPSMTFDIVQRVWPHATLRYCADGAANRLYECTAQEVQAVIETPKKTKNETGIEVEIQMPTERQRQSHIQKNDTSFSHGSGLHGSGNYIPDVICGDLDSLHPHVRTYYKEQGTQLQLDKDQDSNDLDKCVAGVVTHPLVKITGGEGESKQDKGLAEEWVVVIIGAFSGRLDQEMASYHSAYKWVDTFDRFVLLSRNNWAEPLRRFRRHRLITSTISEGPHCGLLALHAPAEEVHSSGLQWNLSGQTIALGGFVSTSNVLVGEGRKVNVAADDGADVEAKCKHCKSCISRNSSDSCSEGCRSNISILPARTMKEDECKRIVHIESAGGGSLLWVCSLNLVDSSPSSSFLS